MKSLLDTNIIIHREASKVINQDIGTLYRWLERAKYIKCIHSISIDEIEKHKDRQVVDTFHIKLDSYEQIEISSPLQDAVKIVSDKIRCKPK